MMKRPTPEEVQDYLRRDALPQSLAQHPPPRIPSHVTRRQGQLRGLEISVRPVLPPSVPAKDSRYLRLRTSQSARNLMNGLHQEGRPLPLSSSNGHQELRLPALAQQDSRQTPFPRKAQSHANLRRERGEHGRVVPHRKQTFYSDNSESEEEGEVSDTTFKQPVTRRNGEHRQDPRHGHSTQTSPSVNFSVSPLCLRLPFTNPSLFIRRILANLARFHSRTKFQNRTFFRGDDSDDSCTGYSEDDDDPIVAEATVVSHLVLLPSACRRIDAIPFSASRQRFVPSSSPSSSVSQRWAPDDLISSKDISS